MANLLGAEATDRTIGQLVHKCRTPGDGIAAVLALGAPGSGKVCLATLGPSSAGENSPFWVIKTVTRKPLILTRFGSVKRGSNPCERNDRPGIGLPQPSREGAPTRQEPLRVCSVRQRSPARIHYE